jgi:hypothetical protein
MCLTPTTSTSTSSEQWQLTSLRLVHVYVITGMIASNSEDGVHELSLEKWKGYHFRSTVSKVVEVQGFLLGDVHSDVSDG